MLYNQGLCELIKGKKLNTTTVSAENPCYLWPRLVPHLLTTFLIPVMRNTLQVMTQPLESVRSATTWQTVLLEPMLKNQMNDIHTVSISLLIML